MSIFICMRAFNSHSLSQPHTHANYEKYIKINFHVLFVLDKWEKNRSVRTENSKIQKHEKKWNGEIGRADEWKKSGACTLEHRLIAVDLVVDVRVPFFHCCYGSRCRCYLHLFCKITHRNKKAVKSATNIIFLLKSCFCHFVSSIFAINNHQMCNSFVSFRGDTVYNSSFFGKFKHFLHPFSSTLFSLMEHVRACTLKTHSKARKMGTPSYFMA